MMRQQPSSTLFPYTTLFRSGQRRLGVLLDCAIGEREREILAGRPQGGEILEVRTVRRTGLARSEEHTSELQSQSNLVCRLLLEKKKRGNQPRRPLLPVRRRAQAHHVLLRRPLFPIFSF